MRSDDGGTRAGDVVQVHGGSGGAAPGMARGRSCRAGRGADAGFGSTGPHKQAAFKKRQRPVAGEN